MKYFNIIVDRSHDRSFGIGLDIYFHKHMTKRSIHFHICVTLFFWFIEIQIGDD